MTHERNIIIERQAGADAISAKAVAIGVEHDVQITECVWDIGQDVSHPHAHRLDLVTATKTVRLYFPDLELTAPSANASRAKRTEDRLQRAVAQLLSQAPSATYTYR
jgi:hypothetical protein